MSQYQQALIADGAGFAASVNGRAPVGLDIGSDKGSYCADMPAPMALITRVYDAVLSTDPLQALDVMRDVTPHKQRNQIFLNHIVPSVARQLGEAWLDDVISFAGVTIGCARLQSLVLGLPEDTAPIALENRALAQKILVVVPKGAQHTLGATVLAKQLRCAGFTVTLDLEATDASLARLAQNQRFDVVMISAAKGHCRLDLSRIVAQSRSKWSRSQVFIGGSIQEQGIDLVAETGTNYVTSDWKMALGL